MARERQLAGFVPPFLVFPQRLRNLTDQLINFGRNIVQPDDWRVFARI